MTGGGGFLGKAMVKQLLEAGVKVRNFSRQKYPELEKLGVELYSGEISDPKAVAEACKDCDIVYHVAAKPGIWGPYEEYHRINFTGTENVIKACRVQGVQRLVYTSSPSVVFDGTDMEGVNESVRYPDHYEAYYPQTKAMAEKAVMAANDKNLATVSLRPHLIWGPEDNHLVPRIVSRARSGQLKIVGDGRNKIDTIYIENAADAHLMAADKLTTGAPCAGKTYFITQGDPRPAGEIINGIVAAAGLPPVTSHVPAKIAYAIGWGMETWYGFWGIKEEPRLTRFVAAELATAHWFNVEAATRDLGFTPKVTIEEGFRRLAEWLKTKPF